MSFHICPRLPFTLLPRSFHDSNRLTLLPYLAFTCQRSRIWWHSPKSVSSTTRHATPLPHTQKQRLETFTRSSRLRLARLPYNLERQALSSCQALRLKLPRDSPLSETRPFQIVRNHTVGMFPIVTGHSPPINRSPSLLGRTSGLHNRSTSPSPCLHLEMRSSLTSVFVQNLYK